MTIRILLSTGLFFISQLIYSQIIDTTSIHETIQINIEAERIRMAVERLESVSGTLIASGKKNEVIRPNLTGADLSTNNSRQIFARVPGITIWENDGSGIQTSIATRGLSPNRSWEFGTRQDGYDISPDVFGYPESYYSPPSEALDRIELIRGGSALQFGPQFGGLLNYIIKKGDVNKKIGYSGRHTFGSFGLFNSFNSLGGRIGKISYYTYFHNRTAAGWRDNSSYFTRTGYASLSWDVTKNFNLSFAYTGMNYQSQQAGGLTDEQFERDASQSARARNWFSAPWNVAAITADWKMNERTKLNAKVFGLISERNSVGFVRAINIPDTLNSALETFNPRQVDRDMYKNAGAELRFITAYRLFGRESHLAAGVRTYHCATDRNQLGKGSTGSDFDLSLTDLKYGRVLEFETTNHAVFVENLFQITKELSVTPGVRFEDIRNSIEGYINTGDDGKLKGASSKRQVVLAGVGVEYRAGKNSAFYGNITQAFRPVTYSELTPSGTTDIIDPNLKDATGYNSDLGFRGVKGSWLNYDLSLFYLYYNNRIGTLVVDGVNYRTNIGASVSKGVEMFIEADVMKAAGMNKKFGGLSLMISSSFVNARYTRWDNPAIASDPSRAIVGKRVEYAPVYNHRIGANYKISGFNIQLLANLTGKVYADAANTEAASANGQNGVIKGYEVFDLSAGYKFKDQYCIQVGVNNLTDARYATRRAGGYPGPGLLPGMARNYFITLGITI